MSEREEKLINKMVKLQRAHNCIKLDDEIEKYKKEIKEAEKGIEKTKNEIKNLSLSLEKLDNNNENDSSYVNNIENKKNLLNNLMYDNSLIAQQLRIIKDQSENYQKEQYILNLIENWNPQTMFKFMQLYDKKHD